MGENHAGMTGRLCEGLALSYGYSPDVARNIRIAAGTHDIGKSLIPDNIIKKPGCLSPHEFDIIRLHTVFGFNLLRSAEGDCGEMQRQIAMYHHEKYDGTGYWGLTREMQPVHIRIVVICDVYCALRAERCYKKAWSVDEALGYIEDNAGSHFDPALVGLFIPLARSSQTILFRH